MKIQMRLILPLMLFLLLLVGCNNIVKDNNPRGNDVVEDISITENERCSIDWEQIQFPFDLNKNAMKEIKTIRTNQIAAEIGMHIIEEIHRGGELPEYTLVSITHSIEDNVWCFEYSLDQRNADVDDLIECGCLYVAIDGNKGVLIKAWVEE